MSFSCWSSWYCYCSIIILCNRWNCTSSIRIKCYCILINCPLSCNSHIFSWHCLRNFCIPTRECISSLFWIIYMRNCCSIILCNWIYFSSSACYKCYCVWINIPNSMECFILRNLIREWYFSIICFIPSIKCISLSCRFCWFYYSCKIIFCNCRTRSSSISIKCNCIWNNCPMCS